MPPTSTAAVVVPPKTQSVSPCRTAECDKWANAGGDGSGLHRSCARSRACASPGCEGGCGPASGSACGRRCVG
eukprot:4061796-Prymnesium_polylepis.1